MMSNSKGWLKLGLIEHLNKRTICFQRSDKKRTLSFRAANCGKETWGELMKIGLVSKVHYVASSGAISGLIRV